MTHDRNIDRRAFLRLAGCAGAAALPLVSPAIGLASLDRKLKVAQSTRLMMGTLVAVTVVDPSPQRAQAALEAAFERMYSLTPLFDRHGNDGAVARLNRQGDLIDPSPQLTGVLQACAKVHAATGGAFDITVAPVLDLYKSSFSHGSEPDHAQIMAALKAIGGFKAEGSRLILTKEHAAVTLDGVAKGFIADAGLATIRQKGVSRALINAGGDVVMMGDRGDGRPWRVAVADPHHPDKPKVVVEIKDGALATSGNYEVFFDRDKLFHHIVDPKSGLSPRTDLSSSVRAPSGILADALSTACFVMKPHQAMEFARRRPNVEIMLLTRMGQRIQSDGFTA